MATAQGLPLLISCPNSGGLVLFQGENMIPLSYESVTGLCNYKDGFLVAHQLDGGRRVSKICSDTSEEYSLSDDSADIHDILFDGDNVFVVHTETNEVIQYDDEFREVRKYGLGGEVDSSHVNSVAVYDGRLIASIFGRFSTHRGYKGFSKGAGEVIDLETGETLVSDLSQPHSLSTHEGDLFLCNSETSEVYRYTNYKLTQKVKLPSYPRGLYVSGDEIYVGLSRSRNVSDSDQCAGVAVLDKSRLNIKRVSYIPFDEIYDIRPIHNLDKFLDAFAVKNRSEADLKLRLVEAASFRENEILTLHKNLVEKEGIIITRSKEIVVRDAFIKARNQDLIERDAVITARNQDIVERDAFIKAQNQDLIERDAVITARNQDIVERDAVIVARNQDIVERDAVITARNQDTVERDAVIIKRDNDLVERDKLIQTLKQQLSIASNRDA